MLLGFGGPATEAEVVPFLDRVLAGRPVPRDRYQEVIRHYQAVGGHSPYNEIARRQANALEDKLRLMGMDWPVVAGFLYTAPFIDDALRDLEQAGIQRILGFVLAGHRCEASWDRYVMAVKSARERLGSGSPEVQYPPPWHAETLFVAAVADRAQAALEQLDPIARKGARLIFTAHSIPVSMGGRAEYVAQLNESARLIARHLGRDKWTLAFQSRSGDPRDSWLEPDVNEVLRAAAGGQAVIVPLGFMCDHVEVLFDLDIEAAKVAREAGVTTVRARTVGEHPKFIEMIAQIAAQYRSPASFEPA
jgi:ferrochelatase